MTAMDADDKRRVVLIKSVATNNRFYALVGSERGIGNADTVAEVPDDLVLGIAYPCLEDGLNDFAVIRTTFETLDIFDADDPTREEMMSIIADARGNLVRRLNELHDKIASNQAHFLGTDYNEFKSYALDVARRGYPRRNLDSMMKLNVFGSVAEEEGHDPADELLYRYEFTSGLSLDTAAAMDAHAFIVELFSDVLNAVRTDANYERKYLFDRNVFQKFIAVMFVNYATTDPMFYGINKRDYGVSADKDMDDTPLYIAIGRELREIERQVGGGTAVAEPHIPTAPLEEPAARESFILFDEAAQKLPDNLMQEELLMGTITSMCRAADLLKRSSDEETRNIAGVIRYDIWTLVEQLRATGLISHFSIDPSTD